MDQQPQLKFPPKTVHPEGKATIYLSPEGRKYIDDLVQNEWNGLYTRVPSSIKEQIAMETGVSVKQINTFMANRAQKARNALKAAATSLQPSTAPALPPATQHPSLPSLTSRVPPPPPTIKPPPEDPDRAKERLLFKDFGEAKLNDLHDLLILTPNATEADARTWAEPLDLPEERVLKWFRYQSRVTGTRSSAPPKSEEADELGTPQTLVKHELSPEASTFGRGSCPRVAEAESPMSMDLTSDDDEQQVEMQMRLAPSEGALTPFPERLGQLSPVMLRRDSLPCVPQQLPTPTPSASTSPHPVQNAPTFQQLQAPLPLAQPRHSHAVYGVPERTSRSGSLEEGEITMNDSSRHPLSLPTVGYVTPAHGDHHSSGDLAGSGLPALPVTAPRGAWSPDVTTTHAMPMRHPGSSSSRKIGRSRQNSWDNGRPSHRRQHSWGDQARSQQGGARRGQTLPDVGKGKGRMDYGEQEERSVGPHRDSRQTLRIQAHPHPGVYRDRKSPSTPISDRPSPESSRSPSGPITGGGSLSPLLVGQGGGLSQGLTLAFRNMSASTSTSSSADQQVKGASTSLPSAKEEIEMLNSLAFEAASLYGVQVPAILPPEPSHADPTD